MTFCFSRNHKNVSSLLRPHTVHHVHHGSVQTAGHFDWSRLHIPYYRGIRHLDTFYHCISPRHSQDPLADKAWRRHHLRVYNLNLPRSRYIQGQSHFLGTTFGPNGCRYPVVFINMARSLISLMTSSKRAIC